MSMPKVETIEQWAKRVASEIRRGQLEPPAVKEPKKTISEEALNLAKELGRERAASQASLTENKGLKHYLISADDE